MKWIPTNLSALGFVSRGRSRHRPRDAAHLYDGPYPFVQTGDVKHAGLYVTEFTQTYNEIGLAQSKMWPQGTLCITIAANIAETAILGFDACFPDSIIGFIADETKCDVRFIKYRFDTVKQHYQQVSHGAAQDNLSLEKLLAFKIEIPPLSAQRRIADMLSTYDALIENNTRRMVLLEEEARLLYEEWFVRLRFPGHEHTRIIDGVPDGWDLLTLDAICRVGRGSSPRPINDYMGGTVPWFKIGDATASESLFILQTKEHVTEEGSKRSVPVNPGDLILSNSATCGFPYFVGVAGCIHDGWLHFTDYLRLTPHLLYWYFVSKREELVNSVGDGSTQKNLNTTAVGRLPILLPRDDILLRQFSDTVAPTHSMILNLGRQSMALRAARDLLLPKLMSGEIEV